MKEEYLHFPGNYFTTPIQDWKPLPANDSYKNIIICSLQDLVSKKNRIKCFRDFGQSCSFHLASFTRLRHHKIRLPFMKFIARQLLLSLRVDNKNFHSSLKVNKHDRNYQVWKREPLGIELLNKRIFVQKLEYIHYNPVRAGLCETPEDYQNSSARFYYDGRNSFGMLKHFSDS